ncbi:MAG TPA: heavy metal translocating P-type ATPase [Candidatus Competibacteraceae bacterium]|nr:heavy metal translocating P-type ATPase [Candidatus Competibacteraceae bacterium]
MDCPTEEALIRQRLGATAGIARLDFDLLRRELTVHHTLPDAAPIVHALRELDMAPQPLDSERAAPPPPTLPRAHSMRLAFAGACALGAEVLAWNGGSDSAPPVVILALIAILSAGLPTLKKGWIALRHLTLNMYFLMSLAVLGAALLGQWPEAAMVLFLFALAEAIEALSLARARDAIRGLMTMSPETALVRGDDGHWREVASSSVAVGQTVRVRPGQRIPLDGVVSAGRSSVDQSPITGESLPLDKGPGDTLYAGTLNGHGTLEFRVTADRGHTTLERIVATVQEAQARRAPTQRFVDAFARVYTPAVVALAALVAALPPLLAGAELREWLYSALVLLVIACPCALVISTPVTVVSALAAAARHGILVKGGAWLELGRKLRAMAFDKTGTLTRGRPALVELTPLSDMPRDAALRLAAALESHSEHPLAAAVAAAWRGGPLPAVEHFTALPGRGVWGRVEGTTLYLGNHRLIEELGLCSPALEAQLQAQELQGRSAVVLASAATPLAVLALADTPRATSRAAIAALQALAVHPVMLSGDNRLTVAAVAGQLGITDARAELLPEDKLAAVDALQRRYGVVGMVGDGINDAPALARASIGFAMGAAGSDTALETADVALMDDDPRKLADFIRLSWRTHVILRQNITLALGIKALFLALALAGQATLWMAVFADMGASLLVVGNGLRLLGSLPR